MNEPDFSVAAARELELEPVTLADIEEQINGNERRALRSVRPASEVDDYLHRFAITVEGKCPFGHFGVRWTIAHGVTACVVCGWPGRAYHYPKLGGRERRFKISLPMHPDECWDEGTPREVREEVTS